MVRRCVEVGLLGTEPHRDTDLFRGKAASEQSAVRVETRRVDSRHETDQARLRRERLAGVEETLEPRWCSLARANGRELHVAGTAARFAPRAAVAHGDAFQGPLAPHEDRVADPLLVRRDDLSTEVEPSLDVVSAASP